MAEVAAGGSIISAHRMLGMLLKEKLFKTSLSCKNWCDKLFFAHIARFRDFWPTCDMASHFLLVVCCCALYLLATTEQQRQQSEKSEGGFRTVYDDCATTTKKKAMAMATTMAMSPHCLTQFRLMADKLSARYVLSNSPRPLHRLFMMLLNFALKRSRKRRLAIAETSSQEMTSPPGEERLTARGDKWGQMWEVRNVSIVKINYCGFLSS